MSLTKLLLVGTFVLAAAIDIDGTCENGGNCAKKGADQAAMTDTLGFIQSSLAQTILATPTDLQNKDTAQKKRALDAAKEASKRPTMQQILEMNASVYDIRALLESGATPEVQGIIQDMIDTIAKNLQVKVKEDQDEAKEEVVKRIDSLADTTESAVEQKKVADNSDRNLDHCVTEEKGLLEAYETCKNEEADLQDEKDSKDYCNNDIFTFVYTVPEDKRTFEPDIEVSFDKGLEHVRGELDAYIAPLQNWIDGAKADAATHQATWDDFDAKCKAKTKELAEKTQECADKLAAWQYHHEKCLHAKLSQQVALCGFGYLYHDKCDSKTDFDKLKTDVTTPGTTWSEVDREQEWTHTDRLMCVLEEFKKTTELTTGAVYNCTKTDDQAKQIFEDEVGRVDFQDDKYNSLTSETNFTCAEEGIMFGSGVLWTVPTNDDDNDAWVPSSADYKKETGHTYAIESDTSKPPFPFCVSQSDHGPDNTCGADFACGDGSPKPSDTQCYLGNGCTNADCCDNVYPPAPAPGMQRNGGFEQGTVGQIPTDWKRYYTYGSTGLLSNEQSHSGSASIKFTGGSWQLIENGPSEEASFTFKHGQSYTVTFWAFSTQPGQTMRTEFLDYTGFTMSSSSAGLAMNPDEKYFSTTAANTWEQFTFTSVASVDSDRVRMNIGTRDVAGSLWIDDVIVV